jgi:hypothetical protein
VGEDYSDGDQTVLELLNRFGADGCELAGLQDYREGGDGSSYWERPGCTPSIPSNAPSMALARRRHETLRWSLGGYGCWVWLLRGA